MCGGDSEDVQASRPNKQQAVTLLSGHSDRARARFKSNKKQEAEKDGTEKRGRPRTERNVGTAPGAPELTHPYSTSAR